MKKLLMFALLIVVVSGSIIVTGCGSGTPPPNPGFRVKTRLRFSFFGFPIPFIRLPLPAFPIRLERLSSSPGATGTIPRFPIAPPPAPGLDAVLSNPLSRFDAFDGIAPAIWRLTVPNNILTNNRLIMCGGQMNSFAIFPGESHTFSCRRNITLSFVTTPALIDAETAFHQVTIASSEEKSVFFGAPSTALTAKYYKVDQNGDAVLVTTRPVTSVSTDGLSVVVENHFPREHLPDPYTNYVVLLIDETSDYIGTALVTVDNLPYPCPPSGGIDQDTCEQVLGRTWDPENCSCQF